MKQTWSELIERAKNNDQEAFGELYQNSYYAVYRTVKSMVRDDDAALDIVQDAYIKGFDSLSSLEEPNSFVAWMKQIAANKAKDWFKKKQDVTFSQLTDDDDEDESEPDFEDDVLENSPEAVIDRNETARLIEEILSTLSEEQRIIVGMFYYQEMSVLEIADMLGISENTVKSRLNYSRKKIRAGVEALEKRGTKLYGLAPIPFLIWLFRNQIAQLTVGNAPAAVFGNIMSGTASSGSAASATSQAGTAAAAGKAGGIFASLGAKIAAAVLAVAIVGGGIGAAIYMSNRSGDDDDSHYVSGNNNSSAEQEFQPDDEHDAAVSTSGDKQDAEVVRGLKQSIAAGAYHTVGLRSDGTVVAVGQNNEGQCDVNDWTDIVSVAAGESHTVGLCSDGTVVAVGNNTYGQCDVGEWKNIVAVSAGGLHTVGLCSDGTVVAAGTNAYEQCEVSDWKDIISVSAGYKHTVGLRSDGTAVAVGLDNYSQCNVSSWADIVFLSTGELFTIGIQSDGTVVTKGIVDINSNTFLFTDDWTDIVAITGGQQHIVGLRSDGTLTSGLATGHFTFSDDYYGQCDVSDWTDIKLP